jgi:hypothetical protein
LADVQSAKLFFPDRAALWVDTRKKVTWKIIDRNRQAPTAEIGQTPRQLSVHRLAPPH